MLRDHFPANDYNDEFNIEYLADEVMEFIENCLQGDLQLFTHDWWINESLIFGRNIYPVLDKIIKKQDSNIQPKNKKPRKRKKVELRSLFNFTVEPVNCKR